MPAAPSEPTLDGALAEAEAAVRARLAARAAEAPTGPAGVDRPWLAAALLAWGVVAVSLTGDFAAFRQVPVSRPYEAPAGLAEASLRYGAWLAQGAVERFTGREGRLPSFLAEAGVTDPVLTFEVTGERSYRLVASETIVVTESSDPGTVLGDALDQLRSAPR